MLTAALTVRNGCAWVPWLLSEPLSETNRTPLTGTESEPVTFEFAVSVAVTDWVPSCRNVTPPAKVCVPASAEVKV